MKGKTVAFCGDHTARALKEELIVYCTSLGWQCRDVGVADGQVCDYPELAKETAGLVADGQAARGILICGTGIGMSIVANKVRGIRCVCCSEPYSAQLSRSHNDANCLAIGARVLGSELAKMIVKVWLETEFEGGRHARRVGMIEE